MNDSVELRSVLTEDEQYDILRATVLHFLSLDPLHPFVDLFGQALSDLN